MERTDETMASE